MTTFQQPQMLFGIPSESQMAAMFDPENPACPFNGYIGNREGVDALLDIAYPSFAATGRLNGELVSNRSCRGRIRLQGPPSTGKTSVSKMFAKLLGLPFVSTEAGQIKNTEKVWDLLANTYTVAKLDFQPVGMRGSIKLYEAPPTILFIDEVHLLPGKVQDAFLQATEANDNRLILDGRELDTTEICFIFGTTDAGKLRPAIKTRFQPVVLRRYTIAEISQMLGNKFPKFGKVVCDRIAELLPVPREALRFCGTVQSAAARRSLSLLETANMIAKREGIREGGINQIGVNALQALLSGGLSKANLCSTLGIAAEEFEYDVLPTLLQGERHPAYVVVNSRHEITEDGRKFLKGCAA